MAFRQHDAAFDEDRTIKFDARLRYVENVINANNVLVQVLSDAVAQNTYNKNIQMPTKFKLLESVQNLFYLLKIHDPDLKYLQAADIDDFSKLKQYTEMLIVHPAIIEMTRNKIEKHDPSEAIRNKFKV